MHEIKEQLYTKLQEKCFRPCRGKVDGLCYGFNRSGTASPIDLKKGGLSGEDSAVPPDDTCGWVAT